MYRSKDRILAGVCAGLAQHLGWRVGLIRAAFVLSTLFFGAGALFYAWLWALVPERSAADQSGPEAASAPQQAGAEFFQRLSSDPGSWWRRRGVKEILTGAGLLFVAGLIVAQIAGFDLQLGVVLPVFVIVVGAVLVWLQLDASRRSLLLDRAQANNSLGLLRLAAGLLLLVLGLLVLVVGGGGWDRVVPAVAAALAVLAGVGLVLAPWGLRIWRDLQDERAARVRETERAEIAAHLHDSVLQTLALIQRRAGSEQDVTSLARAQERELREWIYQDASRNPDNLVARMRAVAAELEDAHGVGIELIAVGDATVDSRVDALVQASREAMLNAVRHAGTSVSVYVEASKELVEVFVRDRGPGFDLDQVPEDRLGLRESILGRMGRHGGSAKISSSGSGTEIQLRLPLLETNQKDET